VAGLLLPGGIALVAGTTVRGTELASVELTGGLAVAVRYRL
jgi:hypothetical protein